MNKKTKTLNKERWSKHPWALNNSVAEVDVNFLSKISNKQTKPYTTDLNENMVHQDVVWDDIEKNGLDEPLLIVIGTKERTIRLESGNHRVNNAIKEGYTHLPVAILIIKDNLLEIGNGKHYIDATHIVKWSNIIKCNYPYQVDPRDILHNSFIL